MDAQFSRWLSDELEGAEALLQAGWSLPNRLQENPDLLAFEQANIFESSWALAGRTSDWAQPGVRRTLTVGRVPIVVVRDSDGALRAFINVCRHRGHPLVSEEDARTGRLMTCRYHSWSYDLAGRLVRAQGLESEASRNSACASAGSLSLTPVRLEVWRGLVFVTLNSRPHPLEAEFLPAASAPEERQILAYQVHHRETFHFAADWKRVQDNVVECYHCAGVHASTLETMYRADAFHEAGWVGRCRYGTAELREHPGLHHSIQLFPGILVFLDPIVGLLARLRAVSTSATAMDVTFLVAPEADSELAESFVSRWARTLAEDQTIVAAQHAALASGALQRSRLVQGREDAIMGAQSLILAAYRGGLAS